MKSLFTERTRAAAAMATLMAGLFMVSLTGADEKPAPSPEDLEASRRAFETVYEVFLSPRCVNCHPSGDAPLQGDEGRIHAQFVKRGPDGKGLPAMRCTSCHRSENFPGEHMPPGSPVWHLPPPEMPMVFQGRTPAQLAAQLQDPEQTGKTLAQMVEHVSADPLVLWAWEPGDGRTKPPVGHKEFAAAFREWVEKGAAVPAE